ncbi:uncharacterized protein LOC143047139 isoform X2 [Mytilus galloprovincialis]|uniref:uncharacterized protein LOC143047139 isoform X2 n=1 Tax=Mytilus galloprovincialis TaxID=29158 RepID=UPI003F7C2F8C
MVSWIFLLTLFVLLASPSASDAYFTEQNSYSYTYTSTVESSFVGTTPSKSGFQYTCSVIIRVYTGFKSEFKVENCNVHKRVDSETEEYTEVLSNQLSADVSRYPLHFTFTNNQIDASSIQVHKDEPVYTANIKRGILSALQLEVLSPNEKQKTLSQVDIFGPCNVHYSVYDHSPGSIFTYRDLTMCEMPQIYTLQMRFFSVIKKIHGGYRQRQTSEPIYPFRSTVNCEYKISDTLISSIDCLQRQSFRPSANNGSIYATAITDVRQKFQFRSATPLTSVDEIESSADMKTVDFLFKFTEEEEVSVSQEIVQNQLDALVKSFRELDLQAWPELYQDFVWFMKHSTEENLQLIINDVLDCHGNKNGTCDLEKKMLEEEYFVDGLLSCATQACITVFTRCIKEDHVTWFTSRYFLYDLAINHEPTEQSGQLVLDICKKTNSTSCWLPLSVMVNKLYTTTNNQDLKQEEGVIFQAISTLHEALDSALETKEELPTVGATIIVRTLKAIGNIGHAVQKVYDTDGRLITTILDLLHNKDVPFKVTKSAIQVFENLELTSTIKEKLILLTSDINRQAVIRTTAFSVLMISEEQDFIYKLINLIHTEQMKYMQTYMVSYVQGLLENDQPDKKQLREAWQKALQTDGRSLPEIDDYLAGQTRYLELSRYFRLPFSVTDYGIQLEFDLVYDPASPVIESAVVRLNYYKDEKYNLLEMTIDIQGLESLLDAVFESKGKGLFSLLSFLAEAKKSFEKGVNPQFAEFDKPLSEALNKIIKLVNHPQYVMPDGILTWKLYGYEVMYVDIGDILSMLIGSPSQQPSSQKPSSQQQRQNLKQERSQQHRQPSGFIAKVMMTLARGYRLIKTRSAKVLDLTKIIPTISGASLNMTVLLTASMGLNVTAKADVSQYMRRTGPVQGTGELSMGFAGEFFGQMLVKLGDTIHVGCRMLTSLNGKTEMENSVTWNRGSKSKTTLANYTATVTSKNIDGNYNAIHIKSGLHHLYDDWTEIPADPKVQRTMKKCSGALLMLLSGNRVCMEFDYPDVADSTTHPYFPLSGPFSVDIDVSRADKDMKEYLVEMTYSITNGTTGPRTNYHLTYSAQGSKLKRQINVDIDQSLVEDSTVAKLDMPETGLHLDYVNKDIKQTDTEKKDIKSNKLTDFHLQIKGLTLLKTKFQINETTTEEVIFDPKQGKEVKGNRSHIETSVSFAVPYTSLDVNFENLSQKLSSHIFTKFHVKYYCSKNLPALYLLHIQPKLAAANHDVSEIEFVNNVAMGYLTGNNRLWSAEDSMYLSYPGQNFTLSNEMVANNTHAHRKTVITYIGSADKQEVIEMNAHVRNESDSTSQHFCYDMIIEQKDRYDIHFKGHLLGSLRKKLFLLTDIHFKHKPGSENGIKRSPEELTDLKKSNGKTCSIFELDEWEIHVNLTVDAKPIFVLGLRRPKGLEFVWHLDVLYPDCKNEEAQIISDGAIGSHLQNQLTDFRYWLRSTFSLISPVQTESKDYDMDFNIEYLWHDHSNYKLLYHGPNLNTSYIINFERFPDKSGEINVKCHMDSPLKLLNFDYAEQYKMVYKGEGLAVSELEHSFEAMSALGEIRLYSKLTDDNSTVLIQQDGYINTSHPSLHGMTNISNEVILSKKAKSGMNVKLTRNHTEYYIDTVIMSPWAIDTSFSIKMPGRPKMFFLSWLNEFVGSSSKKSTIQWNPVFTRKIVAILKAKKHKLAKALSDASIVLERNLEKSIISMVIPFVNKTVGHVISKIAVPVFYYLPLPSNMKRIIAVTLKGKHTVANQNSAGIEKGERIQNDDSRMNYFGEKLIGMVTKLESRMLHFLSTMLTDPPLLIKDIVSKTVKPHIYQAMKTNKISFIQPLIFKWKHFLSIPELTSGEKYVLGLIKSRLVSEPEDKDTHTALIYDRSEVLTFDGKLFQTKGDSTCPHLMAADIKHGQFAVVYSKEGVTVVTKKSMVTIYNGGQVFINSCNTPVKLPYETDEMKIIKKSVSRVISLGDGITISCDINNSHCNFRLKHHKNQTIGLLGNNDGEIGNDFQKPEGSISPSVDQFVSGYELETSKFCQSTSTGMLSQVKACDDINQKCMTLFTDIDSPMAVCFLKVDVTPFLESCQERVKSCMPSAICPSVHAYISKCDIVGITVEPSKQLDVCRPIYHSTEDLPSKALLDIVIVLYKGEENDFCLPCIETLVRYLQTCDKTDVKLTFIQFDSHTTSLHDVLMEGTQHGFRLHSQKVVTIIKDGQDLSKEEYNKLKDHYVTNNIILNIISKYSILKYKGLVGIDWDQRIVSINSILEETRELPQDFIIKLMSTTKGTLFNLMLLEKDRKTRMVGLIHHICQTQAYFNKNC